MTELGSEQISEMSSVDTFAPVAVYRLKYYEPQTLFDNVLYALIRPPRFVYNQRLLIPGRKFQQKFDYQVHNIPFPLSIYWAENPKYIILYLHGNSSSRFQGYLHLKQLPQGACMACFDFKGCGLRKDGKFITLGKQQSLEVDMAVQYLKTYGIPIVGWGRSMGAVSLLMSSKCEIMIADSPFCSLYDLCKETSLNFLPSGLCCLVHCLFPCLFCCVSNGVEKKSGMDPRQLEIIKAVQKQCPSKSLLLLAGKQDSMIHYSHAQRLHNAFRGKSKRLILFDGTHNSTRPQEVIEQCFSFIQSCLESRQLSVPKVLKPLQKESNFKVLKIEKSQSKTSLINNPTIQMSENKQFQSSKETLLISTKGHMQLRPLKISPSKSSPKKMSKIQGDIQIQEQGPQIVINQQQEDIIRQGIGKFQKDLYDKKNKTHKQTFKQISMKNALQNEQNRQPIILKSVKPINSKSPKEKKDRSKQIINDSESVSSNYNQNSGLEIKLISKNIQPPNVIKNQESICCNQEEKTDQLESNIVAPIKFQALKGKDRMNLTCDINTPTSQISTLHQEDVKITEQDSYQNFKSAKNHFNKHCANQNEKVQIFPIVIENFPASQEIHVHTKTEECQFLPLNQDRYQNSEQKE